MKRTVGKIYNRICDLLSVRNMSVIAVVLFVLMLLPVCWLSFVNRASGDDYGYGVYTRAAWQATHSLTAVAQAVWQTIKQYWHGWQGTWFSIAVFSLQPEVFHDEAYVIVAFLMLFLWIGSTFVLMKEILMKHLSFDRWSFFLITIIFLVINIQFIPSTKSAIFWFNGCAHYMLPFAMCQILVVWLLRFTEAYKARYLAGVCLLAGLLGGANYQASLFALIAMVYLSAADGITKKDRRIFWMCVPVLLEAVGLFISMKAPGNSIRGGEEFGLSAGKVFETILYSFVKGIQDAAGYLREKPLSILGLFIIFIIMWEAIRKTTGFLKKGGDESLIICLIRCHPVICSLLLFCLYSAMQAPEIYAGVEVSGGVYNMNYQMFLLTGSGILLIAAGKLSEKLSLSGNEIHRRVVVPGIFFSILLAALLKGELKETTAWKSLEYITSGQAADFKEQMDIQTEILTDERVRNAVVPFINDVQGPLMHMPVTSNKEAFTNSVTGKFYGKDSLIAIPRSEWEKKYNE